MRKLIDPYDDLNRWQQERREKELHVQKTPSLQGTHSTMRSLYAMMARARLAQWPQTDQHDSAVRTARHPCAQMGPTYLCVLVPHAILVQ